MTDNSFGKVSKLSVKASQKDGRTILSDLSFTAPYKIMFPFEKPDGGIQIMPLCASAGIMKGDTQEFTFVVEEGADLEVLSQSFDKIHKMDGDGSALRTTQVSVAKNSVLYYFPQPVIPFAGSAFDSVMNIELEDETSRLFLQEIITCGRNSMEERFGYRRFSSRVDIRRGGRRIYRDNTRYEPEKMDMEGMGMYEGYTHVANIFLTGPLPGLKDQIWDLLEREECEGGVTALTGGDLAVRLYGTRAQKLQQITEQIKTMFKDCCH